MHLNKLRLINFISYKENGFLVMVKGPPCNVCIHNGVSDPG